MPKIQEVLISCMESLKSAGIDTYRLDSEIIISKVLEIEKYRLISDKNEEVSLQQKDEIEKITLQRSKRKPLAYIFNEKEFFSLNFYVDENVLIPRPETEIMTEMVINSAKTNSSILDLCTGSGAISISIKNNRSDLKITASDISQKALDLAKKNAKNLLNDSDINFIYSDLFQNIDGKFDIIVTNPPYVDIELKNNLEPELSYEPQLALYAENGGNIIIEKILKDAHNYLSKDGIIFMEVSPQNIDFIKSNYQNKYSIEIFKDYSGLDRIVKLGLNRI